jgi:hypothetical protein
MSIIDGDRPVAYQHDVFISYSHRDAEWVRSVLVPYLRSSDLRVLIDDDFLAGARARDNMTEAVRQSRYTVAVVTDEWVKSKWSQYESLFTIGLDPDARDRRLIPVMLEKCDAPPYIKDRTWVSFEDPLQNETSMRRLVTALKRVNAARPMDLGPALRACRDSFENACEQIERLADFKHVHDQLHQLQLRCYEPMLREAELFAQYESADETAAENLAGYAIDLQGIIDTVRKIASKPSFANVSREWIDDLQNAHRRITSALADSDTAEVRRGAKAIDRVLSTEPSKLNTRLNEAANQVNFREILEAIDAVLVHARALSLDTDEIRELKATKNAIEQLHENLRALVRDHDYWQVADSHMRRMAVDLDDLIDNWPSLKTRIAVLIDGREWATPLKTEEKGLDAAIAGKDEKQIRKRFKCFRRLAGTRFFEADDMLKKQCDELRRVGEPLAYMAKVLRIPS